MELLNRYLQAVRFWLPEAQQHDIIEELSEDIRSQIEDREAELGRSLADAELEAILKQRGRPMLVASRYLPQQHLIGPMFLPIYWFALKWVLLPIFVLIVGPLGILTPTVPPAALSTFVWGLWRALFYGFGILTMVLTLHERYWGPAWLPRGTTPRFRSLKRYLKAVETSLPWLPKHKDIIAELSEDIRSEIEEREAELGRKLRKAELANILTRRGHPLSVAERFLPQQCLIGPAYYPIYRLVLKVALLWILLPVFVVIVIPVTVLTATHHGLALGKSLWDFWYAALYTVGLLTLLFALLEHFQLKFEFLDQWTLRSLPAVVEHEKPISRCQSISGLVFAGIVCLWWIALPHYPYLIFGTNAAHLTLTSAWQTFYLPVLVVSLLAMAHHVFNLVRPHTAYTLPARRMLINAADAVVGFLFLRAYPFVTAADTTQAPLGYDSIVQTFNGALQAATSIPNLAKYEATAQTFNVVIFSNVMIWVLLIGVAAFGDGVVCLWRLVRPRVGRTIGFCRLP